MVLLDAEEYCGLASFDFIPYRRMTDDELLGYVVYTTQGDPADYNNAASYEKQLRLELARLLGAPLTMTRTNEAMGVMGDYDISFSDEKVYHASFTTLDGVNYSGYLDVDTNKLLYRARWFCANPCSTAICT